MVENNNISARVYSLSKNGNSLIRGWYLLITSDGQEFLMRRHLALSRKSFWQLYRSSIPLKEFIIKNQDSLNSKNKSYIISLMTASIIGKVISRLLPRSFFIGDLNFPISIFQAIINVMIVLGVGIGFAYCLISWRDYRFKVFIKKKRGKLKLVGLIRNKFPYRVLPGGKEYW